MFNGSIEDLMGFFVGFLMDWNVDAIGLEFDGETFTPQIYPKNSPHQLIYPQKKVSLRFMGVKKLPFSPPTRNGSYYKNSDAWWLGDVFWNCFFSLFYPVVRRELRS